MQERVRSLSAMRPSRSLETRRSESLSKCQVQVLSPDYDDKKVQG